jgi:plastocyanin
MKSSSIRFIIFSLMVLALGSVLLVACQRPGTPTANSGSSSSSSSSSSTSNCPTVHMTDNNFAQSSVTLSKGCTLTLTDDVAVTHIIMNGSWVNGNAEPKQEPGAPNINMTFTGNDTQSTPAWNTAGTYHLYCTIHPGMNLTVIVQ